MKTVRRKTSRTVLCPAKKANGMPCKNPAGRGTDHVGHGLCNDHERQKLDSPQEAYFPPGLENATRPETIMEKAKVYQNDPDIFDTRRELGIVRAQIDVLVEELEKDPRDLDVHNTLRASIDTLTKGLERGVNMLAAKKLYLTVAQVEQIIIQLGNIWVQELSRLEGPNPQLSEAIREVKLNCARRLMNEVQLLPAPSSPPSDL